MTDVWVTIEHLHTVPGFGNKAGFCNKTSRTFCLRYGISWSEFIKNGGLWASQLEATNDALAMRLVDWARANTASTCNG